MLWTPVEDGEGVETHHEMVTCPQPVTRSRVPSAADGYEVPAWEGSGAWRLRREMRCHGLAPALSAGEGRTDPGALRGTRGRFATSGESTARLLPRFYRRLKIKRRSRKPARQVREEELPIRGAGDSEQQGPATSGRLGRRRGVPARTALVLGPATGSVAALWTRTPVLLAFKGPGSNPRSPTKAQEATQLA